MRKELHWTKGVFSNTYKISDYRKLIGSLKTEILSSNATGQIRDSRYLFKSQGLFSRTIHVFNDDSNVLIASIKMGFWGRKAHITTSDQNYIWKFKNLWQTKWALSDDKKTYLSGTYNGLISKGNIIYAEIDDLFGSP